LYIETNSCRSRRVALLQDCRESLREQPIISAKGLRALAPNPKAPKSSFANETNMSPRQLKSHCTFVVPVEVTKAIALSKCQWYLSFTARSSAGLVCALLL